MTFILFLGQLAVMGWARLLSVPAAKLCVF